MNGRVRFRTVILAATSAALLFSNIASADKPEHKKGKPRQVVDTGVELLPTDPTAEAMLEQMTSRSTEGLTVLKRDDGTLSMDLEGRFMNVMVATRAPDGTAVFSCQTGERAVKAAAAAETVKAWKARARAENARENAQYLEEK
jgi:hypothetical protein